MKRRAMICGIAALAIAFLAQAAWTTLFNPLVWHLTYIGVHIARAIHRPDYDSVASVRVFDALAILTNASIYFVVLLALSTLRAHFMSRRTAAASPRLP